MNSKTLPPNPNRSVDYKGKKLKEIWLAGGCFWGVQAFFSRVYGVAEATAAMPMAENPTYEGLFRSHRHAETVHLRYDPDLVTLTSLYTTFSELSTPPPSTAKVTTGAFSTVRGSTTGMRKIYR